MQRRWARGVVPLTAVLLRCGAKDGCHEPGLERADLCLEMRNELRHWVSSKGLFFNVNQEERLWPDTSACTVGLRYILLTRDETFIWTANKQTNKLKTFSQSVKQNNSRTRIGFLGFSGILWNGSDYLFASNSILPLNFPSSFTTSCTEQRQRGVTRVSLLLFSLPKCPDFCRCNVLEAEVEGKQKTDGNHAALCSSVHIGPFTLCAFFRNKADENDGWWHGESTRLDAGKELAKQKKK